MQSYQYREPWTKKVRPYPSCSGSGRHPGRSYNPWSPLALQVKVYGVRGRNHENIFSVNKLFLNSPEKLPLYQEHFILSFGALKMNPSMNSIKT